MMTSYRDKYKKLSSRHYMRTYGRRKYTLAMKKNGKCFNEKYIYYESKITFFFIKYAEKQRVYTKVPIPISNILQQNPQLSSHQPSIPFKYTAISNEDKSEQIKNLGAPSHISDLFIKSTQGDRNGIARL